MLNVEAFRFFQAAEADGVLFSFSRLPAGSRNRAEERRRHVAPRRHGSQVSVGHVARLYYFVDFKELFSRNWLQSPHAGQTVLLMLTEYWKDWASFKDKRWIILLNVNATKIIFHCIAFLFPPLAFASVCLFCLNLCCNTSLCFILFHLSSIWLTHSHASVGDSCFFCSNSWSILLSFEGHLALPISLLCQRSRLHLSQTIIAAASTAGSKA